MSKSTLLAISRAIEDECSAMAPSPILLAAFQRERFYRQVQSCWTERAARHFEFIWTAEPGVVREAARQCCMLIARNAPELVDDLLEQLADPPHTALGLRLRATVQLTTRIAIYASGEDSYPSPRTPSTRPRRRSR